MNNSKFSIALVISILALLFYAFISFMGMVYWQNGKITLALLLAIALVAVVLCCVVMMCKGRATRWKRIGTASQVFFGLIILVALGVSTIPFTHFMNMLEHKQKVTLAFDEAVRCSTEMDSCYDAYVEKRCDEYHNRLASLKVAQSTNPTEYAEVIGFAGGDSPVEKVQYLERGLEQALKGDSLESTRVKKNEWAQEVRNFSMWNIATIANLNSLDEKMAQWRDRYAELSRYRTRGVDYPEFTYNNYNTKTAELKAMITKVGGPGWVAILAALICFGLLLLPYFLTKRDLAAKESTIKEEAI
ncbi:MAG: hypothetical protein IK092_07235 [Muribaculaceae bacterium]|nr:hypothetical protein [Muribaculaceae bacterium]